MERKSTSSDWINKSMWMKQKKQNQILKDSKAVRAVWTIHLFDLIKDL
jgi:hypothetical protein